VSDTPFPLDPDAWRQTHLGRLLGHAMRRFDERVLALMAHDVDVPLALSNLAARAQVSAAWRALAFSLLAPAMLEPLTTASM